ncbi:DUF535 family protein [Sodalis glossinidius]|uniref:DUF535 family protein n=1 Tax=Sodalis glossinidius TaxID=63612 RepID=UPI003C72D093
MLQLINGEIKVQQIIAVGDKSHVFQSARYRSSKQNVFFVHYDEFWASVEGSPMAGGLYGLPKRITRKSMDDLPSKKRAEYRRRYASAVRGVYSMPGRHDGVCPTRDHRSAVGKLSLTYPAHGS